MRRGFTLIEMMIAITIFSIVIIFLYQSYDSLQRSNAKYEQERKKMERLFRLKRLLFLDFTLMISKKPDILNQDQESDVLFLQTSNSIHGRINPYVAYFVKDGELFRIESLRPFREYPLAADVVGDVDVLAKAKRFRIYYALKKSTKESVQGLFLVDLKTKEEERVLYKVPAFNQE